MFCCSPLQTSISCCWSSSTLLTRVFYKLTVKDDTWKKWQLMLYIKVNFVGRGSVYKRPISPRIPLTARLPSDPSRTREQNRGFGWGKFFKVYLFDNLVHKLWSVRPTDSAARSVDIIVPRSWRGEQPAPPHQLKGQESLKLPRAVRRGVPAAKRFSRVLSVQSGFSRQFIVPCKGRIFLMLWKTQNEPPRCPQWTYATALGRLAAATDRWRRSWRSRVAAAEWSHGCGWPASYQHLIVLLSFFNKPDMLM